MPVKISANQATYNQNGIINIADVQKIINDFDKKLVIDSIDPARNPVQKHLYFDISMERLKFILDPTINESASSQNFRIYFGLTLPNQLNCQNTASVENTLSITICGIAENEDGTTTPLLTDGQYVLTEGFKDDSVTKPSSGPFLGADGCCVNGGPGGS